MQGECGFSGCTAKLKANLVLTLSIFKAPVLLLMDQPNIPIQDMCRSPIIKHLN